MNRARKALWITVACGFGGLGISWWFAHQPPVDLPPLTAEEQKFEARLRDDVMTLGTGMGPRNEVRKGSLAHAAAWLEEGFKADGYAVERQRFDGEHLPEDNLIATVPGTDGTADVVVVGAHYDTVLGSPGSNDNGSGVAAVRAISAALAHKRFKHPVRFVAFANEEYGFQTFSMGSRVYARRCHDRNEHLRAMLSLETMGYFVTAPGTQRFPVPILSAIYPDRGDFLAVVGNVASGAVAHEIAAGLRERTPSPVHWAALPEAVPGAGWSDHWAFWQEGFPAVMVTDTAPFRYDYYHTSNDTPEKLNYAVFARYVAALVGVVSDLAGGPA